MNASMITNKKRAMDTGDIINIFKKKIKMIDDAKQLVESTERLKFYKTYGRYNVRDELRIYMESRKETIDKDTFMREATIVRSIYLLWLRSASIKKIKIDYSIWNVLHTRGLALKKDLIKGVQDNNNNCSDKDRRYINMVIGTINKYNNKYLEIKTSISIEILKAIRCKYIDRVIMGFL